MTTGLLACVERKGLHQGLHPELEEHRAGKLLPTAETVENIMHHTLESGVGTRHCLFVSRRNDSHSLHDAIQYVYIRDKESSVLLSRTFR